MTNPKIFEIQNLYEMTKRISNWIDAIFPELPDSMRDDFIKYALANINSKISTQLSRNTGKKMDESLLRDISAKYLIPLFSGATIEEKAEYSGRADNQVAYIDTQTIAFKVNRSDQYRLRFRRDQPFGQNKDAARETRVIESFVNVLERMSDELGGPLKNDLLSTFQRRVVAEATAERGEAASLLAVIDHMALWATRLYEGSPIASAIGIDPLATGDEALSLPLLAKEDFFAVLSNGFDSMMILNGELNFAGHAVLETSTSARGYCPWRHTAIADWTASGSGRIAIVLNRLGEILIFRDGQLFFARRSGNWHFLTHGPVTRQMGVPKDEEIRRAIYETALDASFARTGACIGVVAAGRIGLANRIVDAADWLAEGKSNKALAIARIVNGRRFHELDRTLRQELVAVDGATVLGHDGRVLAVGAILKIKGGSTGGGRTAAAKQLAMVGLGVKISQDGGISGYRRDPKNRKVERSAFKVM